jgi:thioredoxin-like negative regulator of GroEL
MLEVTDDMQKVLAEPAVVYFTAPWCGPCVMLKPQVARAGTIDNNNNYYIVNVDEIDKSYLDKFNIQSVPHIFLFENGEIKKEIESKKAEAIVEEVNNGL